jgi:hypothetical protein
MKDPGYLDRVNCTSNNTDEACRQIVVPTETARVPGVGPDLFTFDFFAYQIGNNTIKVNGTFEIFCTKAVVIFQPDPLSTSITQVQQREGNLIYLMNTFSTDDPSCPITSYQANELNPIFLPEE